MPRKRIGELLLERGAISAEQLDQGLALQKSIGERLGATLVKQGFLSEPKLVAVLAEALEIPVIDLATVQPEWAAIHLLRLRFCETHDVFPFGLDVLRGRKNLLVAMGDPLNTAAIDEIEFSTGLRASVRISTLSSIREAVQRYYRKTESAAPAAVEVEDDEATLPRELVDDEVIVGEALEEIPAAPASGSPRAKKPSMP